MSEPTLAEARSELQVQRALDARLDRLVRLGQELVDERLFADPPASVPLHEGQLRHAVALANETSSLEALKSWIRYQIGRPDGRGWRHQGFGDAVLEQIDGPLQSWAGEIATELSQPDRQREIWLRLARAYLGYLSRHFAYRAREHDQRGAPARGGRPAQPPQQRPGGQQQGGRPGRGVQAPGARAAQLAPAGNAPAAAGA